MKANILITGANGFIGSHCHRHFMATGSRVTGLDITENKASGVSKADLLHDDLSQLFVSNQFDLCINAAGAANVGASFESPYHDFQLNVGIVARLLDMISRHSPGTKLINFSSAAVYGNPERLPVPEVHPTNPLSPYGGHKLMSEGLLKEYHSFFGLNTCSLRVFSAYGPGLHKQLFWDVYKKTQVSDKIELFGEGTESRDFIYIADLMLSMEKIIAKAPFRGEAINVASGAETTIRQAVTTFLGAIDQQKQPVFSGRSKKGDPLNWKADISLLRSFGFEPMTTIEDGLRHTAMYYQSLMTS